MIKNVFMPAVGCMDPYLLLLPMISSNDDLKNLYTDLVEIIQIATTISSLKFVSKDAVD